MCRLIETINISDGIIQNIELHNARLNYAREKLFGILKRIDLNDYIKMPENKFIKYKCRVIYSDEVKEVGITPYTKRKINFLKIVKSDCINYDLKYENRSEIDSLFSKREEAQDIIIIKNNRVTDSSFSNLLFFDGEKLYTPANPLLKGIKREKYLREGVIFEEEILLRDIKKFKKVFLINAMLDIADNVCIDIKNIY